MSYTPYTAAETIHCSQCNFKRPRKGMVQLPIGRHHYRNICEMCNESMLHNMRRDDYAEELYEQRQRETEPQD